MSGGEKAVGAITPRDGLAAQLRQLEDFVARVKTEGAELPPEATEMVSRLREIMQALDGLTSSLEGLDTAAPPPARPATPELPAPEPS